MTNLRELIYQIGDKEFELSIIKDLPKLTYLYCENCRCPKNLADWSLIPPPEVTRLKSLRIAIGNLPLEKTEILKYSNLTKLSFFGNDRIMENIEHLTQLRSLSQKILASFPNLTSLQLFNHLPSIDTIFHNLPNLVDLRVLSDGFLSRHFPL